MGPCAGSTLGTSRQWQRTGSSKSARRHEHPPASRGLPHLRVASRPAPFASRCSACGMSPLDSWGARHGSTAHAGFDCFPTRAFAAVAADVTLLAGWSVGTRPPFSSARGQLQDEISAKLSALGRWKDNTRTRAKLDKLVSAVMESMVFRCVRRWWSSVCMLHCIVSTALLQTLRCWQDGVFEAVTNCTANRIVGTRAPFNSARGQLQMN